MLLKLSVVEFTTIEVWCNLSPEADRYQSTRIS